ncbi:alpha/beta-hydrolase [Peniophora sp. CONT]|nr:alpha/beta-hydrolase [Peniophora sp. CONT]
MAFLALLLVALATVADARNSSLKTVDLGYAKYQSDVSLAEGVTSFLGVRYATPPVGDLRFRAPRAPSHVKGVQNATQQPDQCWQDSGEGQTAYSPYFKRDADPVPSSSEDCLFLNVHIPSSLDLSKQKVADEGLPVLVWIHGGGYDSGSNAFYPVELFVRDSGHKMISINIQYRLAAFGFLAGKEVKRHGDLNAGLLDQQFAFKWIQEHIHKFGGNPDKVTIYGQSAGAGSVLQHLVAHGGHTEPPLFRAGMMSSPFLPFQFAYDDPVVENVYEALAKNVSCSSSKNSLDCLRKVSPEKLIAADLGVADANFMGTFTMNPVVDGKFIVERPTVTLRKGHTNVDTALVFSNTHEGTVFVNPPTLIADNFTLERYVSTMFPRLSHNQVEAAVALYSDLGYTNITDTSALVMGESIFICPAYDILDAFPSKVWKGLFAVPKGIHGEDLNYLFTNQTFYGNPTSFPNTDFQHAYSQAFFAMAVALNPSAAPVPPVITPNWPTWSKSGLEMLFNQTEGENPQPVVQTVKTDEKLLERCSFWNSVSSAIAQ